VSSAVRNEPALAWLLAVHGNQHGRSRRTYPNPKDQASLISDSSCGLCPPVWVLESSSASSAVDARQLTGVRGGCPASTARTLSTAKRTMA